MGAKLTLYGDRPPTVSTNKSVEIFPINTKAAIMFVRQYILMFTLKRKLYHYIVSVLSLEKK